MRFFITSALSLAFPFIAVLATSVFSKSEFGYLFNYGCWLAIWCAGGLIITAIAGKDNAKVFWVWPVFSVVAAAAFMALYSERWVFRIVENLVPPALSMAFGSMLVFLYYKYSSTFLRSK